jgi:hypothetical protein
VDAQQDIEAVDLDGNSLLCARRASAASLQSLRRLDDFRIPTEGALPADLSDADFEALYIRITLRYAEARRRAVTANAGTGLVPARHHSFSTLNSM